MILYTKVKRYHRISVDYKYHATIWQQTYSYTPSAINTGVSCFTKSQYYLPSNPSCSNHRTRRNNRQYWCVQGTDLDDYFNPTVYISFDINKGYRRSDPPSPPWQIPLCVLCPPTLRILYDGHCGGRTLQYCTAFLKILNDEMWLEAGGGRGSNTDSTLWLSQGLQPCEQFVLL